MNSRIKALKTIVTEEHLDALLITSPALIIYLTGYAGFSPIEREAYLFITKDRQYIFTDGRYSEAVKIEIAEFELIERNTSFENVFKKMLSDLHISEVGFEAENLTVSEYERFQKLFTLYPINLDDLRIRKSEEEIGYIKKACAIGDKAFTHIQSHIKAGMTERELADELEWFIRKNSGTLSFPTIVAFGKNSAIPHHHTGETTLQINDVILLDFGVRYENYCSDMSRTLFHGDPTNTFINAYNAVKEAQEKAITALEKSLAKNNSALASTMDKAARAEIERKGYPVFSHALGHGIGVDVHESPTLSPRSEQKLTEGMVFSIEPGIYLPREFGIRIEDLFTIQKNTLVKLTEANRDLISL